MSEQDVDPQDLQRELDQIKGAMGIEERYPGQRRMWLVYGVVIGLTAIITNVAFTADLPNAAYIALWYGMVGVIAVAQWRLVSNASTERSSSGLDWWILLTALIVSLHAMWTSLGPLIAENSTGAARGAHYFSHVLIFLGLGLLVAGNILKAERIRRRDRLPFYAGGVWMLVLGVLLPHSRYLQLTGYALFGVLFLIHSVAAYALTK
ncbi:hypothetical protein [Halostella pelagica]|uniref:hypothetical protein n=1 Tax=Halostella pelagica TaxID=2583824 RepID=UPI0010811765|nr:hypothetical protein [Halostella pelagica]